MFRSDMVNDRPDHTLSADRLRCMTHAQSLQNRAAHILWNIYREDQQHYYWAHPSYGWPSHSIGYRVSSVAKINHTQLRSS